MKPFLAALFLALASAPALAALSDEIQVYDESINKPGEWGLEVHVNRTPKGRSQPDYPGEITPNRGLRVTPELSYGLTPTVDVGLYTPLLFEALNQSYYAGPKFRAKWLPLQPGEAGGFFAGINWELAMVRKRFEAARNGMEFRPILGYRDSGWAAIVNPVLSYDITQGYREGGMNFSPAVKVSKTLAEGIAGGFEYYADLGKLAHFSPRAEQAHTLYLVTDVDRGPVGINFGIGRGLNAATDKWTVKAILDIPFGH
ncbi:MAG: uncharacterized protein H6R10_3245 [Rhodocyclaceae bacterium]|nr:uncharacterized protein [Rhodocyclaceae bacterium]